jgi:hypothetical protein
MSLSLCDAGGSRSAINKIDNFQSAMPGPVRSTGTQRYTFLDVTDGDSDRNREQFRLKMGLYSRSERQGAISIC